MANPKEYPNFVKSFEALGAKRIKEIAKAAGVPATDATTLLERIKTPGDIMRFLTEADEDAIGLALGLGARKAWKPKQSAEEIAKLPFYLKPSYVGEVYQLVQLRNERPRAPLRASTPKIAAKLSPKGKTHFVDEDGIRYRYIEGGTFDMGLSAAEKKDLLARAKKLGPEASEHAKIIAKQASPVREVTVAPFYVAEALVGEGGVPRFFDAEDAAAHLKEKSRRLPTEAEWEYLARRSGTAWLALDDELDLAFGEWVDDGWHETYKRAPATSEAWEPREEPETTRGGARALSPWQNPGEELLLHVTYRSRSKGRHAVRYVVDTSQKRKR